jgi:hypothetical protein
MDTIAHSGAAGTPWVPVAADILRDRLGGRGARVQAHGACGGNAVSCTAGRHREVWGDLVVPAPDGRGLRPPTTLTYPPSAGSLANPNASMSRRLGEASSVAAVGGHRSFRPLGERRWSARDWGVSAAPPPLPVGARA